MLIRRLAYNMGIKVTVTMKTTGPICAFMEMMASPRWQHEAKVYKWSTVFIDVTVVLGEHSTSHSIFTVWKLRSFSSPVLTAVHPLLPLNFHLLPIVCSTLHRYALTSTEDRSGNNLAIHKLYLKWHFVLILKLKAISLNFCYESISVQFQM